MAKNLTLGIARIGDLLLENRISFSTNGTIENIELKIPVYQRPYKWTAKNVNQLLDDIDEARMSNKEVYRVGTLILHRNSKSGTFDIVDGQQRSITFALMLKCLCPDKEIELLGLSLANNSYNVHNVLNNYRVIERRLDNYVKDDKDDEREAIKDYIINHCELIVVITDDLSEAFQFFDSQNARGKELYPHDLLKAYHLREMNDLDANETEKIVKIWEDLNQQELSKLFQNYLYRIKEWINGNWSTALNDKNIGMFKGVSVRDNYPYAQFYKAAFAYAEEFNHSYTPFVTGMHKMSPFQLNTPIIAGKPFFDYAKHYFDILADIQNNDKYEGYFVNDNEIIKTLNLRAYKNGTGNKITRLMLDTAILLYVDRFCPDKPSKTDTELLDQFIVYAFIWAYSMRAQYYNVGWLVAQNYILGRAEVTNSFNIYKLIADADSPGTLLSTLSDIMLPISEVRAKKDNYDDVDADGIAQNYLYFFNKYKFWEDK